MADLRNTPMFGQHEPPYSFEKDLQRIIPDLPTLNLTDLEGTRLMLIEQAESRESSAESLFSVADHYAEWEGTRVRVRIYHPSKNAPAPAIVYAHAGGFVLGNVDTADSWCRQLAKLTNAVVVSVDYRLAPEHPYPAAIDDCEVALAWMRSRAVELGIDVTRIVLMGDSAGAGIIASLVIRLRNTGARMPSLQVLCAPQLDPRGTSGSMHYFTTTPLWNSKLASQSWKMYLGDKAISVSDPESAPALLTDATGLPETFIYGHEFDPLRDDAVTFASSLFRAGVPTGLTIYRGTFHGSRSIESASSSKRIINDIVASIVSVLQRETNAD